MRLGSGDGGRGGRERRRGRGGREGERGGGVDEQDEA